MGDDRLTPDQKRAVDLTGTNLLVAAGAGTGKTRVLVERFVRLVASGEALATEILALTFTEKAAAEMKSRILNRFRETGMEAARRDLESSYISTIHAFASRLLREHPVEAGVDPDFRVLEDEETEILREQALDLALETGCSSEDGTFELLKTFGENTVRSGLKKALEASRVEGLPLADFFSGSRKSQPVREVSLLSLLDRLGEKRLAEEAVRFIREENWDWKFVEEFKAWSGSFSKRGKKGDKELWRGLAQEAGRLLSLRLDLLAAPWRQAFERLALNFERFYEARKKEEGLLDFDDLQIKVLSLFQGSGPGRGKLRDHYQRHFKFIMVDEFQDTNPLQTRLVEILSSGSNLFFVGDYKQSIYGFRGTSPDHFLLIEKRYREGREGRCLSLTENFRARWPVLEFINRFFQNLWKEEGYRFEPLAAAREENGHHGESRVEWNVTDLGEKESLDHGRMREAARMAGRIAALHEERIPYGDIAVLFQAMTSSGIYEQALKKAGIPFFVVAGRGFYHQPEIRDMMSFLACLENPLSDIALAAALRSPLFQVCDDTLFWLAHYAKERDENRPLYHALAVAESMEEIPGSEKEKLGFFKAVLEEFLREKDRLRLAELLDRILEKTHDELNVLAGDEGIRKYANLKKLVDLAREYEAREIMPVGDFIRTIRGLETRQVRESEAQVEAEKSGRVVRLMTIHAAKGLEFPVVILADLAHQKQTAESRTFLAAPGLGFGLQAINGITREKEAPFSWQQVSEGLRRREREEWKRLFYVAATRARDFLILSGVRKERKNPKENFHEMSSWMEWLGASAEAVSGLAAAAPEERSSPGGRGKFPPARKKKFEELLAALSAQPWESLLPSKTAGARAEEAGEKILEGIRSSVRMPSRVIDLPVSAYVAFHKSPEHYRRVYEIGYPDRSGEWQRPDESQDTGEKTGAEEEPTPADFGTAVHRVLERMDFQNPEKSFSRDLPAVFRLMGGEAAREARAILEGFVRSPVFSRLRKAARIWRELPFVLNERHGRVEGVLDLLFQDDAGRWVILDYKAAVGSEDKVREAGYELQMAVYAVAVCEILKRSPDAAVIYFLKNQWEHTINFDETSIARAEENLRGLQASILEFARGRAAEGAHVL